MAWVKFSQEFSWPRLQNWHARYVADGPSEGVYNVTRDCKKAAIAEGAAVATKPPPRTPPPEPVEPAVAAEPPPDA